MMDRLDAGDKRLPPTVAGNQNILRSTGIDQPLFLTRMQFKIERRLGEIARIDQRSLPVDRLKGAIYTSLAALSSANFLSIRPDS